MTHKEEDPSYDPMNPSEVESLKHWGDPVESESMKDQISVDCGWGRLIFGQTYQDPIDVAKALRAEKDGRRDVALYMRDPHVAVAMAPQDLFLDPSLTFRIDFRNYKTGTASPVGVVVRPLDGDDEEKDINRLYMSRSMVPAYEGFYKTVGDQDEVLVLIAEDADSHEIIGAVTGVDHRRAINDPDNGSSLWALVVDPQCQRPAVGEALVRALIEEFARRGRSFMDLSVMHDNTQAIGLYKKLGFAKVPVYCIKNKNSINEPLFLGPDPEEKLNVYASIIVDEARRRGISVQVLDAEGGFFQLTLGGRSIVCRESLSELTTAIAMSRCDDKAVTRRLLHEKGLKVPAQMVVSDDETTKMFLETYKRIVVKPTRGEQGRGITVDVATFDDVQKAIEEASHYSEKVILEEFVRGEDLRIIVIENKVVAAAVRRPAKVCGNGKMTVRDLIKHQSRRRAAATHGESSIPLDEETRRCVQSVGYDLDEVLPDGLKIPVRKTANLHTGGTIHDVTNKLHPKLVEAAVKGSVIMEMPLVGFDFMVPSVDQEDYVIIEANERPGLANHEPQPTVERFIDMLFPYTKKVEI